VEQAKKEFSPLQVLLADDHPAMRQGLSLLLAANGFKVAAEEECAATALERLGSLKVGLALVDLSFEGGEGFQLIAELNGRNVPVIVYSMHEDRRRIKRALASGAKGYVSKREDSQFLLQGISEILQNRLYLSPRIATAMQEQLAEVSGLSRCSEREMQILQFIGKGLGNSEIADRLDLSVRTVETYCARVAEKLDLSGMKELRQFAIQDFHTLSDSPSEKFMSKPSVLA
jgi:DNA-binding NarL/FixJ family response regulator